MKTLPWFYAPHLDARPESAVLAADESRHLARSRRLGVGGEQKLKLWISASGEPGLRLT